MLDQPAAVAKKKKKVTLCHEGQTISVSKKAKKKHLKHGDALGACPTPPPPPPPPGSTTTTTTTLPPGSCAGGEGSNCGTAEIACICAADPSNLDLIRCVSTDGIDFGDTCLGDEDCTDGKICALDPSSQSTAVCLLPCSV